MDAVARPPGLVPELDVTDLDASIRFLAMLGFEVQYARPAEGFAYLAFAGVHLMLQTAGCPGRRFRTADLVPPHGRGVNFQPEVSDVMALHEAVVASGASVVDGMEDRWYAVDEREQGNRQFVVADPDGYLWRPFQDLGNRPC